MADLAIIILAAGQGTRMKDPSRVKALYALNGEPMIDRVLRLAAALAPVKVVVVVGYQKELVVEHVRRRFPALAVEFAVQEPQRGTGHAAMQAKKALRDFSGDILILYADVPLLTERTLHTLLGTHAATGAAATVLTADLENPAGYGRIVRSPMGALESIVEDKDATVAQRALREVNSGIYVFQSARLFEALGRITPANAQGEYYLTDVIGVFRAEGLLVAAGHAGEPGEIAGINSPEQLQEAESLLTGGA